MSLHSFRIHIILAFFLTGAVACEQSGRHSSERLLFNVRAGEDQKLFADYSPTAKKYNISTDAGAFFPANEETVPDSIFTPKYLNISINLLGELIPSLLNPNGYRVQTTLQLQGGTIIIDHTNEASLVITPAGDSLYAIRGEGIVSGGTSPFFENITGFFFEESTYKILSPSPGAPGDRPQIININCKYELIVDF
ncbi:MAG TPA: hypothetical protein VM123_10450 [archaeon]|nr:hypothetical protein [archaeon]